MRSSLLLLLLLATCLLASVAVHAHRPSFDCGTCAPNGSCNQWNSACACNQGWAGDLCTTCADGYSGDACDQCLPNYGQCSGSTACQVDTDADGLPDACDPDDDNDGWPDVAGLYLGHVFDQDDNCRQDVNYWTAAQDLACFHCPPRAQNSQLDTDGDGIGDACDTDDDNDGILDWNDNCPLVPNPDQQDTNGRGVGDACDADLDEIRDDVDNCPLTPNFNQDDKNGDTVGDACDFDGDAWRDECDNCPFLFNTQEDTDGDKVGDACDNCPITSNSDQLNSDTDPLGDACDNCPFICNEDQKDSDFNGVGDLCDEGPGGDLDNDGVLNGVDNCPWVANPSQADQDGDQVGDACSNDIDGDGIPNESDNCPLVFNTDQQDTDADGTGDACDDTPTDGIDASWCVRLDVQGENALSSKLNAQSCAAAPCTRALHIRGRNSGKIGQLFLNLKLGATLSNVLVGGASVTPTGVAFCGADACTFTIPIASLPAAGQTLVVTFTVTAQDSTTVRNDELDIINDSQPRPVTPD